MQYLALPAAAHRHRVASYCVPGGQLITILTIIQRYLVGSPGTAANPHAERTNSGDLTLVLYVDTVSDISISRQSPKAHLDDANGCQYQLQPMQTKSPVLSSRIYICL